MRRSRPTAYHEAGHAVAAVMVGYYVHGVDIVPDSTQGRLGYNSARGSGDASEYRSMAERNPATLVSTRRFALANIFYSGAGAAAQSRYTRRPLELIWLLGGAADDFTGAMEWAAIFHPETVDARSAVLRIWSRTAALVTRGGAWQAVVAVADALHAAGSLDGRDVERLISEAWPEKPEGLALDEFARLHDCLRVAEQVQ